MLPFLRRRWFLVALVSVLGVGFAFAQTLEGPAEAAPRNWIVAAVLFLMALPLDVRAMWRAMRQPWPAVLAVVINYGVLPPLAWAVSPLLPRELGIGLIIMASIPSTMASAAVWTRRAGGNEAVAIFVTMITNLACVAITPLWLQVLTSTKVQLDVGELVERLAYLVLLPIVLAQLLRLIPAIAAWATARKGLLSILSQCGILCIVFIGAVGSGVQLAGRATDRITALDWTLMFVLVILVHYVALKLGHWSAHWLGMNRADQIAVGFAGSQKTLTIGLDLGLQYFDPLTILPMVAYHVCQLLLDAVLADRMHGEGKSRNDQGPMTNDQNGPK